MQIKDSFTDAFPVAREFDRPPLLDRELKAIKLVDPAEVLEVPQAPKVSFNFTSVQAAIDAAAQSGANRPSVHVLRAGTGLGKTTAAIKVIADKLKGGEIEHVIFFVPTHKMTAQVADDFEGLGITTTIWKGRTQPDMCEYSEVVQAAMKARAPLNQLCLDTKAGKKCAFYDDCGYRKQRKAMEETQPEVLIAPVQYLQAGGIPKEFSPDLFIVDENPFEVLTENGRMNVKSFGNLWVKSEKFLVAQEAAIAALEEVSKELLLADDGEDMLAAVIENNVADGNLNVFKKKIESIVRLRRAEVARIAGINAGTTSKDLKKKKGRGVSDAQKNELDFWTMFLGRLRDLAAGNETTFYTVIRKEMVKKVVDGKKVEVQERFLEFVKRHPFPFYEIGGVVLDASADEVVYERLFESTHEVNFVDFEKSVDPIHRTLITGRSFSKTSLTNHEYKGREKTIRLLESVLKRIAEMEEGRRILLIAPLAVVNEIKAGNIAKDFRDTVGDRLKFGHFKSMRGENSHQGCETVVMIGKLELPDTSIRLLSAALSADPLKAMKGEAETEEFTQYIQMKNGQIAAVKGRRYTDLDKSRVQYLIREEELVQCEGRLRSVRRGDEDLRSYLIGNAVPLGFEFDEVKHVDNFDQVKDAKLAATAEELGGVLSQKGYAAKQKVSVPNAKKHLTRRGFDGESAPAGWLVYKAKVAGQRGRPTLIYATESLDEADRIALVAQHAADLGGVVVERVVVNLA